MFEKYTEKARRALIFARYEASKLCSRGIETEQILLGVLRECEDIINEIFSRFNVNPEKNRREVEGDRLFVDGFLCDPMPVGVAIKHGANVIVTLGFESPYQHRVTSVLRFAFQLSSIMSNNLLRANYAFHNLAHHTEILPIIPQFRERISLFDTDKIPYVIEEGERAAERELPYLRRLLGTANP